MGIEERRNFTGVNSYSFLILKFPKELSAQQIPSPTFLRSVLSRNGKLCVLQAIPLSFLLALRINLCLSSFQRHCLRISTKFHSIVFQIMRVGDASQRSHSPTVTHGPAGHTVAHSLRLLKNEHFGFQVGNSTHRMLIGKVLSFRFWSDKTK